MQRPRLGFLGIGIMGEAMTRRLLDRRWQVTVWNLERERLDLVTPHGAVPAASPADVLDASDIVLMCVLDGNAVRNCVYGADGLASSRTARGKLVIDLSTIDPASTREIAGSALADAGIQWTDSPVSGGPVAAREGTLTIMSGGEAAVFERALQVLSELGTNVTRVGPIGAGQTAKILNQAIVGVGYVLMTEAVALAEAAGIDAERLPACLAGGLADSTLLRKLYPRVVQRAFDPPQAYTRQLLKDMKAVGEFAQAVGCDLPLVLQARDRFAQYVDSGHAMSDPASLIRLYESGRAANR